MLLKFWFLYTSLLLFICCAAQGTPSGGPPDKVGPTLISVQPPNETLNISPEQKITLLFDEILHPASIMPSIQIDPNCDYKIKYRQRKITIYPKSFWPKDKIIRINISREVRDYRKPNLRSNNIMAAPIQLIFSMSSSIPPGHIRGEIINYNFKSLVELGLYEWPLTDSSMAIQKVEADENGLFQFGFINYGEYTLAAVEAVISNIGKQIRKENYAILTSDYIQLSQNNKYEEVQIFLSPPLERLKITSVEMRSQYFANLFMSDKSEELLMIDTLNKPGDSIKINLVKSNRLETYRMPEYAFILPEITDTTGPVFKNSDFVNDDLIITFSEPVHLTSEAIIIEKDSLNIPLNFQMENGFTVLISNLADTIQNIKLLGGFITDWNENIMPDSVQNVSIQWPETEEKNIVGGNILGSVQYQGKQPLMIEAREISQNNIYTTQVDNQKFRLENLQPGKYELWGFESLHREDPGIYFSGTWNPFHRAARFSLYPDSVEVRARWDVEGIIINFD